MGKGALLRVERRVRIGDTHFLRLINGFWVFDRKNGKTVARGPVEVQPCSSADRAMVIVGGSSLSLAPTREKWALTGHIISVGQELTALAFCELDGEWWVQLRLATSQAEGWCLRRFLKIADASTW